MGRRKGEKRYGSCWTKAEFRLVRRVKAQDGLRDVNLIIGLEQ